jgi:tetratricopeptide repeat protein 30
MLLLTKLALAAQDARNSSNTTLLSQKVDEYDSELEKYIPILMAQAHIYWEMGQYSSVIKIFNQSREFAGEHETWRLNVAHAHFMMVRAF